MTDYTYPDENACLSIQVKLGIEKESVYLDQDWEYILADECRLHDYVEMYNRKDTTNLEKRVLGCFIIQSLTELLPDKIPEGEARKHIAMLAQDSDIHESELKYWSNEEEGDEENWAYVTKYIREITYA